MVRVLVGGLADFDSPRQSLFFPPSCSERAGSQALQSDRVRIFLALVRASAHALLQGTIRGQHAWCIPQWTIYEDYEPSLFGPSPYQRASHWTYMDVALAFAFGILIFYVSPLFLTLYFNLAPAPLYVLAV